MDIDININDETAALEAALEEYFKDNPIDKSRTGPATAPASYTKLSTTQRDASDAIVSAFARDTSIAILVSDPQAGKTGVCISVCESMILKDALSWDDVVIITGMADTHWVSQTKIRFPDESHNSIFHGSQLHKLLERKLPALLVMDEVHFATQEAQRPDKILSRLGLDNLDSVRALGVKLLLVSATPAHVLYHQQQYGDGSGVLIYDMKPAPGYLVFSDRVNPPRDIF